MEIVGLWQGEGWGKEGEGEWEDLTMCAPIQIHWNFFLLKPTLWENWLTLNSLRYNRCGRVHTIRGSRLLLYIVCLLLHAICTHKSRTLVRATARTIRGLHKLIQQHSCPHRSMIARSFENYRYCVRQTFVSFFSPQLMRAIKTAFCALFKWSQFSRKSVTYLPIDECNLSRTINCNV